MAETTRSWAQAVKTFVILSSAIVSSLFGYIAGMPYGCREEGAFIGAGAGLLAAIIWIRRFLPPLRAGTLIRPGTTGGLLGLLVGVMATVILHAALAAICLKLNPNWLFIGLICGAISGFVLGEICGRLAAWILKTTMRSDSQ